MLTMPSDSVSCKIWRSPSCGGSITNWSSSSSRPWCVASYTTSLSHFTCAMLLQAQWVASSPPRSPPAEVRSTSVNTPPHTHTRALPQTAAQTDIAIAPATHHGAAPSLTAMQWQLHHLQQQLAAVETWAAHQRSDNEARQREQAQRAVQHGQEQDGRIAALESHIVHLECDLESLTEEVGFCLFFLVGSWIVMLLLAVVCGCCWWFYFCVWLAQQFSHTNIIFIVMWYCIISMLLLVDMCLHTPSTGGAAAPPFTAR